jgi:hypothetical protein
MSLRDPSPRISPFIRYNPCTISEEQGTGKPPGEKSRPVVVEGELRKNMGVVNAVSPPRGWSNGLLIFILV